MFNSTSTTRRWHTPRKLTVAATLAGALFLSACGGTSAPTSTGSASANAGTGATSAAPAATAPAGQGNGNGGDNQGDSEFGLPEAEIVVRVDAVEQDISACMRAAGFEYIPVDYGTVRKAMDTNSKPSGLDPAQFRTEFGYGITTLSVTDNAQATIGLGGNVAIRDGLPPADSVAWSRALLGENTSQTFAVGLDNEDLSRTGGCTRSAVERTFSADELGAGFVNYQNAEGARVDEDPRVIDAYKAWASCMRDAGYSYDHPDDIDLDLLTRLNTITGGGDIATLSGDAAAALTQLQGEERAIAAADDACDIKHVADVKKAVEIEILGAPAN